MILLLKADGETNTYVTDKLNVTEMTISHAVCKFEEGSVKATLADAPGRGRRRKDKAILRRIF